MSLPEKIKTFMKKTNATKEPDREFPEVSLLYKTKQSYRA